MGCSNSVQLEASDGGFEGTLREVLCSCLRKTDMPVIRHSFIEYLNLLLASESLNFESCGSRGGNWMFTF